MRRFLEVIDAGNQVGRFAIPIQRVVAPAPPEPGSPFQHADFERMMEFAPLARGFTNSLRNSAALDAEQQWGRLLFSAILFGGLPLADWLMAIPDALRPPADDQLRWLDLRMGDAMIGATETYLTVQPNGLRRLKTGNAKLRLPLHLLMTEVELRLFHKWCLARRQDGAIRISNARPHPGIRGEPPRLALAMLYVDREPFVPRKTYGRKPARSALLAEP